MRTELIRKYFYFLFIVLNIRIDSTLMKVISVIFLLCLAHSYAGAQTEYLTHNGNTFTYGHKNVKDTFSITDPLSGETKTAFVENDFPVKVNGRPIYAVDDLDVESREEIIQYRPEEQIIANLKKMIYVSELPDGELLVRSIRLIIDESGKIIYSNFDGLKLIFDSDGTERNIGSKNRDRLANGITMPVAIYKGRKVPYVKSVYPNVYRVVIKGGKASSNLRK